MATDYRTWASTAKGSTGKVMHSLDTTVSSCSMAALAFGRQRVAELGSHRMTEKC